MSVSVNRPAAGCALFITPALSLTSTSFLQTGRAHRSCHARVHPLSHRRLPVPPSQVCPRRPTILAQAESPRSPPPPSAPTTTVTWTVGTSRNATLVDAVPDAVRRAVRPFVAQRVPVTLAVIFVHSSFNSNPRDDVKRVVPTLKKALAMHAVLTVDTIFYGSTTGAGFDPDDDATVTLALAHFPKSTFLRAVHVAADDFSLDWTQQRWQDLLGLPAPLPVATETRTNVKGEGEGSASGGDDAGGMLHRYLFVLYHPDFAPKVGDLLDGLDFAYPSVRKVGTEAGRSNPLHDAALLDSNGATTEPGALLLAVASRDVAVNVSVAQGARCVGPVMEVTAVKEDGSVVTSVREIGTAGQSTAAPMTLLDMWVQTDVVSLEDRRLVGKYLMLGTELRSGGVSLASMAAEAVAKTSKPAKGDGGTDGTKGGAKQGGGGTRGEEIAMLSRKVVGYNETTGAVGVEGGKVRVGTRAQFQIRDEEAARAELTQIFDRLVLEGSSRAMDGMSMMGALLFVDGERGAALHGNVNPDLDRVMFGERFAVPVAMSTGQGQIGPLPSGGFLGEAGDSFWLSASAVYVSFYARMGAAVGGDGVDGADGAAAAGGESTS